MPDLNKDHGAQAGEHMFSPIEATSNGEEAGTVQAPSGEVMYGVRPEPQPGNKRKLH